MHRPVKPPLCKGRWHGGAVTEGLERVQGRWVVSVRPQSLSLRYRAASSLYTREPLLYHPQISVYPVRADDEHRPLQNVGRVLSAPEGPDGEGRKSVKKRAALLHVLAFSALDHLFGVPRGEQPLGRAAVRSRSDQSPSGALKHTSGPALRDGGARCAPPSARYRK